MPTPEFDRFTLGSWGDFEMTAGLLLLAPAADDQHRSALRQQQHPIWIPRRSPNHNRLPYLVVALALSLLVIAAA